MSITPRDFELFNFKDRDYSLRFHKGSSQESRGVGSVARSFIKHLNVASSSEAVRASKVIHLFPFFTGMPVKPLKRSALIVHDVGIISLPEVKSHHQRYKELLKKNCQESVKILTGTDYVKEQIITLLDIEDDKITVLPNIIERSTDIDSEGIILPRNPYFLYFSAGNKYKNLITVFKAFKDLDIGPVELVVAGDNQYFQRDAVDLGISDRVHFVGRLNEPKLNHYIANSIGITLPTLYEGFGLSPFEAALLGKGSIIADKPSLNRIIRSDEALWCDALDVRQWTEKMTELYTGGLPDDNVRRLKERTLRSFNGTTVTSQLLDILDRID